MNLQELKDKYAIEKGFESWEDLIYVTIGENDNFLACDKIIEYETEVEVLIQKQCLENAWNVFLNNDVSETLEKELIKDENNIIK